MFRNPWVDVDQNELIVFNELVKDHFVVSEGNLSLLQKYLKENTDYGYFLDFISLVKVVL